MIKKAFANRRMRKAFVFAGVFVIALAAYAVNVAAPAGEAAAVLSVDMAISSETEEEIPSIQAYKTITSSDPGWDIRIPLSAERGSDDTAPNRETTTAIPPAAPTIVEEKPAPGFVFSEKIPLSRELQQYTFAQCLENGLSYELVLALMWRESRFQVTAVGYNQNGTQDSGVMQINDVNRDWLQSELGITDLMDPRQNIAAGTAMLGRLIEKYGEHDALMAYQYGETGMQRKWEQGVTTNAQIEALYAKREEFVEILDEAEVA